MCAVFRCYLVNLVNDRLSSQVFEEYQKYGAFHSLDDLMAKTKLWLMPQDHILDYAKPTMPHVVRLGGLTIKPSSGKLPTDLAQFVEGARSGAIVVSFGSVASSIPRAIVEKFADAFRRLEREGYRVVWRLEDYEGVEMPANVRTMLWLPQKDLLAHPSVKVFVTHCGNNGQYEALYHGVPMIGFPLMADEEYNARRLQHKVGPTTLVSH